MIDFFPFFCREWHQNFREECPEGILDKQHIIKIYDEISPFGNSKDFVDNIFRVFDKGTFLSESTDVFVITPNKRTFFFPETENLNFGDWKLLRK